jgi:thiol-disulfide isomerase/thioredoxin
MSTSGTASAARRLGAFLTATGLLFAAAHSAAQEAPGNFVLHETPKPVPELRFEDGSGRALRLADFRGKVVLLNIWATWCGPCRREMPTLDRLQAEVGGPAFEVVALSIDRGGIEVVRKFYAEVGLQHLAMYVDSSGKSTRELGVVGLPTTLLADRDGREVGRLVGPAEWDAPAMIAFLRSRLSVKTGSHAPGAANRTSTAICHVQIPRRNRDIRGGDVSTLTFQPLETSPCSLSEKEQLS